MADFTERESFIRNRINENLLKVKNENTNVKALLSTAVEASKPEYDLDILNLNSIYDGMVNTCRRTKREDLLRTCIILGTSRNTQAQENLICVLRAHLGKIKEKDYKYIADLIYLKDSAIVEKINNFLCYNLYGYNELHKKYYKNYYGF